ncbi:FixH family protein [Gracilibacillus oryzae]|nr:FixH family protein [Gracilibacillus oryzae]
MTKKLLLVMLLVSLILAACGNPGEEESNAADSASDDAEVLAALEVNFITEPDVFLPGQEETIQVKVTHGEEPVEDADEVLFEIWEKGKRDESVSIESEHEGEGVYALAHTFEEQGIYEVTAHVTARAMHTMPTQEFNVGNVADEEYENMEEDEEHPHDEHRHEHGEESVHEEHQE